MPQYELGFFQWRGHRSKMFIKSMAALHSEPGGRRKDTEGVMFVFNKQRHGEFIYTQTQRDGCCNQRFPVCVIVNHGPQHVNEYTHLLRRGLF